MGGKKDKGSATSVGGKMKTPSATTPYINGKTGKVSAATAYMGGKKNKVSTTVPHIGAGAGAVSRLAIYGRENPVSRLEACQTIGHIAKRLRTCDRVVV